MQVKNIKDKEYQVTTDDGIIVAGVNLGYYRPWIYPLCTPSGLNVLREFPPDHGFHNGAFFGHYPVLHDENEHNFWGAPPFRYEDDEIARNVGRLESSVIKTSCSDTLVSFQINCDWITDNKKLICREIRSINVSSRMKSTKIEIKSQITNLGSSDLLFRKSKCSGHAYRLASQVTDGIDRSLTLNGCPSSVQEVHERNAYRNCIGISTDLISISLRASDNCDYFVRDYGLVSANPFLSKSVVLKPNDCYKFDSTMKLIDVIPA